jgi:hypothetical protein
MVIGLWWLVRIPVHPCMPFRRHGGGFNGGIVRKRDPALSPGRDARCLLRIILVAELILADEFAIAPRKERNTANAA